MKRIVFFLMVWAFVTSAHAQTENILTQENFVTETFKGVNIEMPGYREINSGSKIIVSYGEDCPAEMRGAFEYAVKLWEEVLPMTLPIKIKVGIESVRGGVLSKVSISSFNFNQEPSQLYLAPLSMIKSALLQESHARRHYRFINEIQDVSFLEEKIDMTITYNKNLLNQISYSLDGEPNESKYDFVTVALRDIAIGLGFTTNFTANVQGKTLVTPREKLTPFESHVLQAVGGANLQEAYNNATKGSVPMTLYGNPGHECVISLYAPNPWVNGKSLRFLTSENDNPLSRLLDYDFGKGYIMRDLSGMDWKSAFEESLDWIKYVQSDSPSGSVSQNGDTNSKLPFKGDVALSFTSNGKSRNMETQDSGLVLDVSKIATADETSSVADEIKEYCKKYNSYSPNGPTESGLSLSVLKKDGSWDVVHSEYYYGQTVNLKIEDLTLHYPQSEYARGTTGGLRYRLSKCEVEHRGGTRYYYTVKYFTRDYTPQTALIKYSSVLNTQSTVQPIATLNDDYFVDMNVGISNIEGTTRVIVEQWDEGEALPFQYEATDFRKGYFVANLDRELSTRLTVICYNDNGFQRSNTITIPPVGYSLTNVTFMHDNQAVHIDGISSRSLESGNISCTVQEIATSKTYMNKSKLNDNTVDIGSLPKGMYVLVLYNGNECIGNYKFAR